MKFIKKVKSKQFEFLIVLLVFMIACKSNTTRKNTLVDSKNTVKIGLLFSLTGDYSITEASMRDAAAMAIEEINNDGGILGKQIELLELDVESKDNIYKGGLIQMANKSEASAIFCNLPVGNKRFVLTKVEKGPSLLFDLNDYTFGSEHTNKIVSLGSSPEQLLLPGVRYMLDLPKKPYGKFFLLGTNDTYSKNASQLIKQYLTGNGVAETQIKEKYIEAGTQDLAEVVVDIKRFSTAGNACVLTTVKGGANVVFYREFANQGLSSLGCPVMSFTISEDELRQMGAEFIIGQLFCRNYFQSVDTDKNIRFVSDFKLFCAIKELPGGIDRVTGEGVNRAYTGVYLWKKAVEKANSFQKEKIRKALFGLKFNSPAGMVKINEKNLFLEKPVMVGESNAEGQIDVLWQSLEPISTALNF